MAKLKIEYLSIGTLYLNDDNEFHFIGIARSPQSIEHYSLPAIKINITTAITPIDFYCDQTSSQEIPVVIMLSDTGELYSLKLLLEEINTNQQLPCAKLSLPKNVNKVSSFTIGANVGFIAMIDEVGDLYTCGNNTYGQLGIGRSEPKYASEWSHVILTQGTKAKAIIATTGNVLGIVDNCNKLWLCGYGKNGQLGNGRMFLYNKDYTPTLVSPSSLKCKIIKAQSLTGCTIVLDDKGKIYTTGNYMSSYPYRENTKFSPASLLPIGKEAIDMASSDNSILIIDAEGALLYGDGLIHQTVQPVEPLTYVSAIYLKNEVCIFATRDQKYWICKKVISPTGKKYFDFHNCQQLPACTNVALIDAPAIQTNVLLLPRELPSDKSVFGDQSIGDAQL